MGRIGKYIDEMCRTEPQAMLRFLSLPVGRYSAWPTCLVGTIRWARGLSHQPENGFGPGSVYDHQTGVYATRLAFWVGSKKMHLSTRFMPRHVMIETAAEAARFTTIMELGSPFITALVKRRIERRLHVVASPAVCPPRVKVGTMFFTERPATRREVAYAAGFEEPLVWHPDEVDTASLAELTLSG